MNAVTAQTHKVSVLMGDIIGSEEMERAALHSAFNEEISHVNAAFGRDLVSPLTITLGDEFQGLVRTSAEAFTIANILRLALLQRQVPCRFVIGQAEIETPVNPTRAWNMLGSGLSAARERLNDKSQAGAYRFSLLTAPKDKQTAALQNLLDAFGAMLSDMEDRWSEKQLATIALWIRFGGDVDQVAHLRNVTKRSVYYALEAAEWDAYMQRRDTLRTYLEACLVP